MPLTWCSSMVGMRGSLYILILKIGLTQEEEIAFTDIAEVSNRDAWHRILIAMTRPIDTLVVELSDLESNFSQQMMRIAKKFPDIVEVIN